MTCRVACTPPVPSGLPSIYRELAGADRWEDFHWLAVSEGMAPDRIARLWDSLRARWRPASPEAESVRTGAA